MVKLRLLWHTHYLYSNKRYLYLVTADVKLLVQYNSCVAVYVLLLTTIGYITKKHKSC